MTTAKRSRAGEAGRHAVDRPTRTASSSARRRASRSAKYTIGSNRSRTCREKNQYVDQVPMPSTASRSPRSVQLGAPAEATATITTPTNDAPTSTHDRSVTRSCSRYARQQHDHHRRERADQRDVGDGGRPHGGEAEPDVGGEQHAAERARAERRPREPAPRDEQRDRPNTDPHPQPAHRERRPGQVAPLDQHRPPRPDERGEPDGRDAAAMEPVLGHPPMFPAGYAGGGRATLTPMRENTGTAVAIGAGVDDRVHALGGVIAVMLMGRASPSTRS